MDLKRTFLAGIAAVAGFFHRSPLPVDTQAETLAVDPADEPEEKPKRRGGYSGAKLERKAAKGRVGMATLR